MAMLQALAGVTGVGSCCPGALSRCAKTGVQCKEGAKEPALPSSGGLQRPGGIVPLAVSPTDATLGRSPTSQTPLPQTGRACTEDSAMSELLLSRRSAWPTVKAAEVMARLLGLWAATCRQH